MPRQRHDPSKHFVGFTVGDVVYAVRIEVVREIVNPKEVVELPQAPRSVRGVADLRKLVVPVVDLRERFGLPNAPATRKNKWIVVDVGQQGPQESQPMGPPSAASGGRFCALVVDAVTEVFGTGGAELRPAPPLGGGDDIRGIAGVTKHGDRLVFVLDVRAFSSIAEAAMKGSQPPPSLGLS